VDQTNGASQTQTYDAAAETVAAIAQPQGMSAGKNMHMPNLSNKSLNLYR
jgi:hypothetical protein